MRRAKAILTALLAVAMSACSMETGATLEGVRILHISADPPALIPPGEVTASVRIYDDQFRVPDVHWYLTLDPAVDQLPELRLDLSDPSVVTDGSALVYLGSGTTISGFVPEIPPELLPEGDLFDTFPLSLVVSVRIGDEERKGLRRIRVVVPELVRRTLRRQLDEAGTPREPTDAELAAAVQLRLNRNPSFRAIATAIVPADQPYTVAMTEDLADRRSATTAPARVPALPGGDRALRIVPDIFDADLTRNTEVGEPGYNKLEINPLATAGTFYPLTLTSFDWAPFDVKKKGFSKQVIEPQIPELTTIALPLFDRQSGTALAMLEVDTGAPPRLEHQGRYGSVLLAENKRMQWFRDDTGVLPATTPAGRAIALTARVWAAPVQPHGITAVIDAIAPTTAAASTHLEAWGVAPAQRAALAGTAVTFAGTLVRIWQPE